MAQHSGPVMAFFGNIDDASRQEAIEYIKKNEWTQEDVKLVTDNDYNAYLVIAKRRLW